MSLKRRGERLKKKYAKILFDLTVRYTSEAIELDKDARTLLLNKYKAKWCGIVKQANYTEKGVIELDMNALEKMIDMNYKSLSKHFKPERPSLISKIKSAFKRA